MSTLEELKYKVKKACGGKTNINQMIENPTPESRDILKRECSIPGWKKFIDDYLDMLFGGTRQKIVVEDIPEDEKSAVVIEEEPIEESTEVVEEDTQEVVEQPAEEAAEDVQEAIEEDTQEVVVEDVQEAIEEAVEQPAEDTQEIVEEAVEEKKSKRKTKKK